MVLVADMCQLLLFYKGNDAFLRWILALITASVNDTPG